MRRPLFLAAVALCLGAGALRAQGLWSSSLRLAPQFNAYNIKEPFNEKISELSVPLFFVIPVATGFNVDIGTAFASVQLTRRVDSAGVITTTKSSLSGLTDTQLRLNYTLGQDYVVLTAGLNLPTGSATLDPDQVEAATRIGSDFFTFPVSGFGSGFGVTGGVAVARPVGAWNLGFGASVRHSSEYEPFRNTAGSATKYQPGPEYRARFGVDRPMGTGRVSLGLIYSKFGDDKANAATFSSGDRFVTQFALNNSLTESVNYSFVVWDLVRTSGTLIDGAPSPSGNIGNALLAVSVRGPNDVGIEPSIETRMLTQQGSDASVMATLGLRCIFNRGIWAVVPGVGYSMGSAESASLSGYRATLGMRFGGGS